jgi:uncharacterized protein
MTRVRFPLAAPLTLCLGSCAFSACRRAPCATVKVGFHDTIGGCCSSALNRKRYGKPQDPNCRQNFLDQLARYGMGPRDYNPTAVRAIVYQLGA